MKATGFEFRYRLWLITAIVLLGFLAPWQVILPETLDAGPRTTTWLWLGFQLSGLGISSTTGIVVVTWASIGIAAFAACIRVWGTAYLGSGVVNNAEMMAGQVLADGPYRYVRNPLYLGSWLMVVSIAMLMSPSGAAVSLLLFAVFLLRVILREEAFLVERLGERYAAYRKVVPRLIPSLWPRVAAGGQRPRWGMALAAELMPLGVLVSFAALSWQYNSELLTQAVLVSFGVSLVVRALALPKAG